MKQHIIDVYGKEPSTLHELGECVVSVIKTRFPLVGFAWGIYHYEQVSNTHCSPIGKPRNFYRTPDIPHGYNGFSGRVWLRFSEWCYFDLSNTLTYTGNGGSGTYNGPWEYLDTQADKYENFPDLFLYSYEYKFFLDDWPLIEKYTAEQQLFNKLANLPDRIVDKFQWVDEEVAKRDQEFLNKVKNNELV